MGLKNISGGHNATRNGEEEPIEFCCRLAGCYGLNRITPKSYVEALTPHVAVLEVASKEVTQVKCGLKGCD